VPQRGEREPLGIWKTHRATRGYPKMPRGVMAPKGGHKDVPRQRRLGPPTRPPCKPHEPGLRLSNEEEKFSAQGCPKVLRNHPGPQKGNQRRLPWMEGPRKGIFSWRLKGGAKKRGEFVWPDGPTYERRKCPMAFETEGMMPPRCLSWGNWIEKPWPAMPLGQMGRNGWALMGPWREDDVKPLHAIGEIVGLPRRMLIDNRCVWWLPWRCEMGGWVWQSCDWVNGPGEWWMKKCWNVWTGWVLSDCCCKECADVRAVPNGWGVEVRGRWAWWRWVPRRNGLMEGVWGGCVTKRENPTSEMENGGTAAADAVEWCWLKRWMELAPCAAMEAANWEECLKLMDWL